RCRIWAEGGVVDSAAHDFSQTEEFLKAAEEMVGPYEWSRYDVLCLPPSFPYGGMENPCLTFVTPTLLAGDRSLAFVVAHEISHSWTGNLITNRTWEHFWLNEGWTMWLERNIIVACTPSPPPLASQVTANPHYYDFSAQKGWKDLQDDVERFQSMGAESLTALVPDLEGIDPDDAFSTVPYEKGFTLLNELQRRVGKKEFHGFARAYIAKFRMGIIDSSSFRDFFLQHFKASTSKLKDFNWQAWFEDPGMPPITPKFDDTLCVASWRLADAWLVSDKTPAKTEAETFKSWTSPQKV
ncbi:unnamed protein product, partial [Discosporangium mesarthrocarpum]